MSGYVFVRLDGVPHHVEVTGGGPVCVLSAGLGLAWFEWDPVVRLLARHRTVVRFDRPGLGLSGHARVPPTLSGEADRIARVLDAVGLGGRAVTVVGHSLAGFHAEAFARLHPERTAALVLVDSSVEERTRALPGRGFRVGCARAGAGVLSAVGVPRALGPLLRGGSVPRELRWVYGASRVWRAGLVEYVTYGDVAHELALLREEVRLPSVPVTVVAASRTGAGRWVSRQRDLAAGLGAHFRVLAPATHVPMPDHATSLTESILTPPP
ncbi:alpha/beta fold hydrolase [Streptomyces sp. NPDC059063]|uniref:alpha/beta fold hydrolase n=1 Tax=unclassified Streptomyces TaxID=2593676 RepID=UPI0036A26A54